MLFIHLYICLSISFALYKYLYKYPTGPGNNTSRARYPRDKFLSKIILDFVLTFLYTTNSLSSIYTTCHLLLRQIFKIFYFIFCINILIYNLILYNTLLFYLLPQQIFIIVLCINILILYNTLFFYLLTLLLLSLLIIKVIILFFTLISPMVKRYQTLE